MENKKLFINGFWLKIIAMVAMTFDHVGFALGTFYYDQSDAINVLVSIFRGVGQTIATRHLHLRHHRHVPGDTFGCFG